jgi:hypothetical protein
MTYVKSLRSSGPGNTLRNINIHTGGDGTTINVNGKDYHYPYAKSVVIDNDDIILDGRKTVAPWAAHYDPAVDGVEPHQRSLRTSVEVGLIVVPLVIAVTFVVVFLFG